MFIFIDKKSIEFLEIFFYRVKIRIGIMELNNWHFHKILTAEITKILNETSLMYWIS